MNVVVIGSGYVGLVTGCCLAEAGNRVVCVDHDARKVATLRAGRVPFHEPELEELLDAQLKAGRLSFDTRIARAMPNADLVYLAVGTPAQEDGTANLENLLRCVHELAETAFDDCIVIIKSTVPVGTADRIEELLNTRRDGRPGQPRVRVASNPEFLAEGRAVQDFRHPERIVIGTNDGHSAAVLARLYAPFDKSGQGLMFMDRRSAEFAKYACNAMLAARISMINELAGIAGGLGADIEAVARVLKGDPRIGAAYLRPGVGYGGSCLPKDLHALIHLAQGAGEPALLLRSVQQVNGHQVERLLEAMRARFNGSLEGRRIAVWGLSFKPDTDDVRAAPSLALIRGLLAEGAEVHAYDPVATAAARTALGDSPVEFHRCALAACEAADALAVMTEWDEFRNTDLATLTGSLRGRMVFDGRGLYDTKMLKAHGLEHYHVAARRPPPRMEQRPFRESAPARPRDVQAGKAV